MTVPAAQDYSDALSGDEQGAAGGRLSRPAAPVEWMQVTARRLAQAPATVAMVVALWSLGIATGSIVGGPSHALFESAGASTANLTSGHLVMLVSSGLFASNLASYLLATVLMLVVGVAVERRHGTRTTILLAVIIQIVGLSAGLLLVRAIDPVAERWNDTLSSGAAMTPILLPAGLLLANTASQTALWRRRVRLIGLSVLTVLALYGGYLDDALTLVGGLVGLMVGVMVWVPAPSRSRSRSSRRETRSLVGSIVAVTAVGPLLVVLSPSAVGPLRVLKYLFVSPRVSGPPLRALCAVPSNRSLCAELIAENRFSGLGPSMFAALPAVLVLVLAWGLTKGRRSAWWMALATHLLLLAFAVSLPVSSATRRHVSFGALASTELTGPFAWTVSILTPGSVVIVLLVCRSSFQVRPPPGTYRRLITAVGVSIAVMFGVYTVVGTLIAGQISPHPHWAALARNFPQRLVPPGYLGFGWPRLIPHSWAATLLLEWTGVLVWLVALTAALHSFRRTRDLGLAGDRERARNILCTTGGSNLSYMTTWPDHSYWFNATGTTYIAYRTHGGVALTTTDPVGPLSERGSAITEFATFCDAHSWTPCLYSCTAATQTITAEQGWHHLQVAEETVIELGAVAFKGRKFQDIRTAANRAARDGITAQWTSFPTAPLPISEQIRAISEEWVADKALPEMGFTLGGLEELNDPDVRCLIAVGARGAVQGITSWLPVYRAGAITGWTLDFMRRPGTAFPGVMEFLLGNAILKFQSENAELVSLSGAPLARVADDQPATGLQRVLDVLAKVLEPAYGFQSLLHFKAKFQPTYQPLYMCYPDSTALPRIAAAIGHAYLPDLKLTHLARLMGSL